MTKQIIQALVTDNDTLMGRVTTSSQFIPTNACDIIYAAAKHWDSNHSYKGVEERKPLGEFNGRPC